MPLSCDFKYTQSNSSA